MVVLACVVIVAARWRTRGAPPAVSTGEIRIGMAFDHRDVLARAPHYVNAVRLAEKQINQAGGINGKKLTVLITIISRPNPGRSRH